MKHCLLQCNLSVEILGGGGGGGGREGDVLGPSFSFYEPCLKNKKNEYQVHLIKRGGSFPLMGGGSTFN